MNGYLSGEEITCFTVLLSHDGIVMAFLGVLWGGLLCFSDGEECLSRTRTNGGINVDGVED